MVEYPSHCLNRVRSKLQGVAPMFLTGFFRPLTIPDRALLGEEGRLRDTEAQTHRELC